MNLPGFTSTPAIKLKSEEKKRQIFSLHVKYRFEEIEKHWKSFSFYYTRELLFVGHSVHIHNISMSISSYNITTHTPHHTTKQNKINIGTCAFTIYCESFVLVNLWQRNCRWTELNVRMCTIFYTFLHYFLHFIYFYWCSR